jgi:hypothetical protein
LQTSDFVDFFEISPSKTTSLPSTLKQFQIQSKNNIKEWEAKHHQ